MKMIMQPPHTVIPAPLDVMTAGQLDEWIAALPLEQSDVSRPLPGMAEHYVCRFYLRSYEAEAQAALASAINSIAWFVHSVAIVATKGIAWRIRPEFVFRDHLIFYRYGDDGPDKDHAMDRRGWADDRYGVAKGYVRLAPVSACS